MNRFILTTRAFVSKNSPTILSCIAVAGLVGTVILSTRATPKALLLLEEAEREKGGRLTSIEIIKEGWSPYIPTIVAGAATIACIIGSNHISLKRHAALASIYTLTDTAFREYRSKVVEQIGKNKAQKIHDEVQQDRVYNNPVTVNDITTTGHGNTLCFDGLTGRYFLSDIEYMRRSVNNLNHKLLNDMYVSLNDLYYELGLREVEFGNLLGWDVDQNLIEPVFTATLSENEEPCISIHFPVQPRFI